MFYRMEEEIIRPEQPAGGRENSGIQEAPGQGLNTMLDMIYHNYTDFPLSVQWAAGRGPLIPNTVEVGEKIEPSTRIARRWFYF